MIVGAALVSQNAGPGIVADFEPPGVVKSLSGGSMTAENEHTVKLRSSNCNVLGSCGWEVFTKRFLLFPAAFL